MGRVFGRMAATAPDGNRLTTVVSAARDKESYRLSLTGIGVDGHSPAPSLSSVLAQGLNTGSQYYGTFDTTGEVHWASLGDDGGSQRLVPDTYRIIAVIGNPRLNHDVAFGGWTIDRDRGITVDARTASQVRVRTARPTVRDRADVFFADEAASVGLAWRPDPGVGLAHLLGPQPDGLRLRCSPGRSRRRWSCPAAGPAIGEWLPYRPAR